jgi:pilus assembly protein FimV
VAAVVRSPSVPLATPALPAPAAAVTNTLAAAATPIASTDVTAPPAAGKTRSTTHVKIGAKATLRGVAWRVGARSDSDLKKTMLAIFRANPNAFEGNINRLRRGAVLTIPSAADISTISKEDAGREIRAQMTAWRSAPQRARAAAAPVKAMPAPVQAMTAPVQAMTAPVRAADAIKAGGDAAEAAALNLRVQSLEHGLHDMQVQLERERDKLLSVQAQVRHAEEAVSLPVAAAPAPRHWLLPSLLGGLGLLAGALGAMFLKRRVAMPKISAHSTLAVSAPAVDETLVPAAKQVAEEPVPRETPRTMPRPIWQDSLELSAARNSARDEQEAKAGEQISADMNTAVTAPPTPVSTGSEDELRAAFEDTHDLSGDTAVLAAEIAAASGDTANMPAATIRNVRTLQAEAVAAAAAAAVAAAADDAVTVMVSAEALRVDTTNLDYNLMDLDRTAQHVQMPSELHERVVVKERRSNLVDVLKKAVEREPDRRDLRMKLLETYYAAAAANRKGFLEVVQKLARERDHLGAGEWDKIAYMGKQIAADTSLFSGDSQSEDDDELADCA